MKQATALNILKTGDNVFLTGSAGSGKTYTLNQYIQYLRARRVPVATTASTGIAATHMNGTTIHSWSGIGIKDELTDNDLANLARKQPLKDRLQDTAVLIIDEISMLHAKQLNMVNQVLKHLRQSSEPFGGLQVVVAGDFFQLPPVGAKSESNRNKFAFMGDAWLEADFRVCYLTEQHRQTENEINDNSLTLDTILNQIREQAITPQTIKVLQSTYHHDVCTSRTRLYTHNFNVDKINQSELAQLQGDAQTYDALTFGDSKLVETLKRTVRTSDELTLKIGAKVMFTKNNNEIGVSNGTMGEVTGFKVLETRNRGDAFHNDTIDSEKEELDKEANDEYDLTIAYHEDSTHEPVSKSNSQVAYPVVRLNSAREVIAEPEEWLIEDEYGEMLASYSQVPLALAWAITIHKSQGMTLDAAEIDLSKTFELGQGYVALSRLKDLAGLKLLGMNDMSLRLDPLARGADARFKKLSNDIETAYQTLDTASLQQSHEKFVLLSGGTISQTAIKAFERQQAKKQEYEQSVRLRREQTQNQSPGTLEQTKTLLEESLSVAEIAEVRGLAQSTIMNHIAKLKAQYPNLVCDHIRPDEALIKRVKVVADALVLEGDPNNFIADSVENESDYSSQNISYQALKLRPIFEELREQVSYNDIRLALIFV